MILILTYYVACVLLLLLISELLSRMAARRPALAATATRFRAAFMLSMSPIFAGLSTWGYASTSIRAIIRPPAQ